MEEKKITGIPTTEEIKLESSKEQWELFSKGLINHLKTTGIVVIDKSSNRQIRISIVMQKIASPDMYKCNTLTVLKEARGLDTDKSKAITNADQFLIDKVNEKIWLFIGYIVGVKTNKAVVILHYEKFNYSVYSVIDEIDEIQKYFPDGIPKVNPSSN